MKYLTILWIAMSLCIPSQAQIISGPASDSLSINTEMFKVQQSIIGGSALILGGAGLVAIGNAIKNERIDTTIHPDNLFFPGYCFIGIGIKLLKNGFGDLP